MTTTNPVLTSVRSNGHTAATSSKSQPADAAAASPSPLPDLTALADDALAALVDQGQAEIASRKNAREMAFLTMVSETAKTLGLSPARVVAAITGKNARPRSTGGSDGRHDVKPVYRDPVSGATWSGRGVPPAWIELGDEINPKTGKRLPLQKFFIAEQQK
jgi:DNA-binding protein H-NS